MSHPPSERGSAEIRGGATEASLLIVFATPGVDNRTVSAWSPPPATRSCQPRPRVKALPSHALNGTSCPRKRSSTVPLGWILIGRPSILNLDQQGSGRLGSLLSGSTPGMWTSRMPTGLYDDDEVGNTDWIFGVTLDAIRFGERVVSGARCGLASFPIAEVPSGKIARSFWIRVCFDRTFVSTVMRSIGCGGNSMVRDSP